MALLAELREDGPGGRLYGDALATVLAVQLLRRYSSAGALALRGPAGLPRSALRRATDYVEEGLAQDITLAALAEAAGFSPYHFARRFKASTGLSPHQYVIRRRVERARRLLTTTDHPVAYVAHETGFASASHLAQHFRRLLGANPSSCR